MTRSPLSYLVLGVAIVALSGCTDFRRALGFQKAAPDEFAVTSAGPLTLPPDYGLRPPHTATGKAATPSAQQQARFAVFRLNDVKAVDPNTVNLSPGEQVLVAKAGASMADARIREQVDAEVNGQADTVDSFVDTLLFWQDKAKPDQSVDANAEAQKIREAQSAPSVLRTDRVTIQGGS